MYLRVYDYDCRGRCGKGKCALITKYHNSSMKVFKYNVGTSFST